MTQFFELYDAKEHLVFSYKTHSKVGKRKSRWVRLDDGFLLKGRKLVQKNGVERDVSINDLVLHKYIPKGTTTQRDTTCDSKFMLDTIHEIGSSIRRSYEFVDKIKSFILLSTMQADM